MQDNNLYQNIHQENASSMLFHIYSRHEAAAGIYRQMARDVESESVREWLSSLAEYRQKMADELQPWVADAGSAPLKPAKEMKTPLAEREREITEAINTGNEVILYDLSKDVEESIGKYYQKAEGNKDVPLEIREKLSQQHERILEVILKAKNLSRVPKQGNNKFEVRDND